MNGTLPKNPILWFFLALFLATILLLWWLMRPFLPILIVGAVVAGVFRPIYLWFAKRMKPTLASFVTCSIIFIILFVPIVLFVGVLSQEAFAAYQMGKNAVLNNEVRNILQGSEMVDTINSYLKDFNFQLKGDQVEAFLSDGVKTVGLFLYQQASAVATNVVSFLFYFFFMLLVIYYLFIDGHRLIDYISNISPLPKEQDEILFRKFRDMAGAVLVGNGLSGVIQGFLGGIAFSMFGLNSPFLWGVIMGALAFLPIVGIGAVMVPTAIVLFIKGRIIAAFFFLIFYALLSVGIEYFFKPALVGKRVRVHTLAVFLSFIGGLKLFGLLGIIYGPLVLTAFLTMTDIYRASYQQMVEPEA